MTAKIAIILIDGFADWEYGLISGVGKAFYGLDIEYFAPSAGHVESQGGLVASVAKSIEQITSWAPNILVVVGSSGWAKDNAPDISDVLKQNHQAGGIVAGICGGTLALAKAKLLDEIPHTSNDLDFVKENTPEYAGAPYFVQSAKAVSCNRIITAPGTAPTSFSAAIFESAEIDKEIVLQFIQMMGAEHLTANLVSDTLNSGSKSC